MTDNQQPSPGNPLAPPLPTEPTDHGNPTKVHDTSSDLVDTQDPNLVTDTVPEVEEMKVFYSFAGGGIAGQNLTLCNRCSALVREDKQDNHTQWHRNGSA